MAINTKDFSSFSSEEARLGDVQICAPPNMPTPPVLAVRPSLRPTRFSRTSFFLVLWQTPSLSHFVFFQSLHRLCLPLLSQAHRNAETRTVCFHRTPSHIPLPRHRSPETLTVSRERMVSQGSEVIITFQGQRAAATTDGSSTFSCLVRLIFGIKSFMQILHSTVGGSPQDIHLPKQINTPI